MEKEKEKMSNEMIAYFQCKMLHPKTPIWNGDYIFSESENKHVKNIKWFCKQCNKIEQPIVGIKYDKV